MPENRFFIDSDFETDKFVELIDEEFRHLQVMRRKPHDHIELVNGRGTLAKGTVISINKKEAEIKINEAFQQPQKAGKIILAQALPRLNALDLIIEKGTEFGASEFWLFPAAHSEKESLSQQQKIRLKHLTISALKQCGRLYLPAVYEKPKLQYWDQLSGQKFFGDIRTETPLFSKIKVNPSLDLIFFVGPEKGFNEPEIQCLEQTIQAKGVCLHENILRAESAALAATYLSYLLSIS